MSPAVSGPEETTNQSSIESENIDGLGEKPKLIKRTSTFHISEETRIEIIEFVRSSHTYPLLVFFPIGFVAVLFGWSATTVFALNLFAVIPLATLLSSATEQLSEYTGQTVGALLNATFGNAVELIMSMVALSKGDIRVVQASMIGAVLSNLLLGLGCCIMAAGGFAGDSTFNAEAAGAMSSLMTLASAAIIIPAVYVAFDSRQNHELLDSVLILSRGTSIVLLLLYIVYLDFSLRTHARLFEECKEKIEAVASSNDKNKNEKKPVKLSPQVALLALVVVTALIAVCSGFIVDTLDEIAQHLNINKEFIGLIILPAVGNAAEYITAIGAAAKNNMNFAVNVAVGSSLQISLMVTPFLVIFGWIIGQPMSLYFEPFYVIVFFLSVLVVGMLVSDGASNHLEGAMLVGMYIVVGIAFYVYPGTHETILDRM